MYAVAGGAAALPLGRRRDALGATATRRGALAACRRRRSRAAAAGRTPRSPAMSRPPTRCTRAPAWDRATPSWWVGANAIGRFLIEILVAKGIAPGSSGRACLDRLACATKRIAQAAIDRPWRRRSPSAASAAGRGAVICADPAASWPPSRSPVRAPR